MTCKPATLWYLDCLYINILLELKASTSGVVVVQLFSHVQLLATPRTAACQAFLSFTISQSLLKLMSTETVMTSNHLILCHPPSPPVLNLSQDQGLFLMTWLFTSGAVFYIWSVFKKWGLKHIPTVSSTLWYVFWSFTVWMLSVLIQKYFRRLPGDVLYEPQSCVFIGLRTLRTTHKLLLVVTHWETQFHKTYTREIKTTTTNGDLIKFISFFTANKTTNKMKRQPIEREKIFANDGTNNGLISKINKQFIQFNNKNQTT